MHLSVKFKRNAVIRINLYIDIHTRIRIHEHEYIWDEEAEERKVHS